MEWYKQQWAEEDRLNKLKDKRLSYLATPGKMEEDVAKIAEYFSPSKRRVKAGRYTKAEALRRREQGGPLEGFQADVWKSL